PDRRHPARGERTARLERGGAHRRGGAPPDARRGDPPQRRPDRHDRGGAGARLPCRRQLDLRRRRAADDAQSGAEERRGAAREARPAVGRRLRRARRLRRNVSRELDLQLAAELAAWRARGLERTLDDGGAPHDPARDFVSNDYLGLARDGQVIEAARRALLEGGAGARAARLLGGGSQWHVAAERAAADWIGGGAPLAALLFPTGYQANLGVVGALAGRGDALCCDELVHASLVDAARLSRAHVHVFRHGDQDELAHALARTRGARRRLILTEGVFGMDGDLAPLAAMHELCERYDAWLVVDEAHGAGVVGPRGRGACAELGLEHGAAARLAARVVTGGKALGGAGAFVVGSARLRELLLQRARSFLFTTSPPPSVAGAL